MSDISEADSIGWEYTDSDIEEERRERDGVFTDFELMLEYHNIDEQEWFSLSSNKQGRLRWNYKKFGTER